MRFAAFARMTDPHHTEQQHPASNADPHLHPGDEAAPGTPGTGENICPRCRGSGRVTNAEREEVPCPACEGTGKIVVGIGGA
jgi:hypothetical protein